MLRSQANARTADDICREKLATRPIAQLKHRIRRSTLNENLKSSKRCFQYHRACSRVTRNIASANENIGYANNNIFNTREGAGWMHDPNIIQHTRTMANQSTRVCFCLGFESLDDSCSLPFGLFAERLASLRSTPGNPFKLQLNGMKKGAFKIQLIKSDSVEEVCKKFSDFFFQTFLSSFRAPSTQRTPFYENGQRLTKILISFSDSESERDSKRQWATNRRRTAATVYKQINALINTQPRQKKCESV